MNTTTSNTMQTIKNGFFLGFFVFLLGASGCEKASLVEQTPALPSTQMFLNDDPQCIDGERREFGMEATTDDHVLLPGMNLQISYFALPGYSPSDECLCRVEHVFLEFDYLPAANDITVVDDLGVVLGFNGPFPVLNGPGAYIEVLANDHEPTIEIGFDPLVQPLPTLLRSGGFCVVDNVSAPDPTTLLTTPYVESDPESHTKKTYIPAVSAVPAP